MQKDPKNKILRGKARREHPRFASSLHAVVTSENSKAVHTVINISRKGAMLEGTSNADVGCSVKIEITGMDTQNGTIAWTSNFGFGISFTSDRSDMTKNTSRIVKNLKTLAPSTGRRQNDN